MTRLGSILMVLVCAAAAGSARADFYDTFSDGWYERDPNDPRYDANDPYWTDPNNVVLWDIDNPDWRIDETLGSTFAAAVMDGELNLYAAEATWPFCFIAATVQDGSDDPNLSRTYFDDSGNHYIVAHLRYPDPNYTGASLFFHGNFFTWTTWMVEYENIYLILIHQNGTEWTQALTSQPDMDKVNGFWIAGQWEGDGDPNHSYFRGACWNGDKYDWDGTWDIERHVVTEWDPNTDEYYQGGDCGVAAYGAPPYTGPNPVAYAAFDEVEARWGDFTTVSRTLSLEVVNPTKGFVTTDPDLLDDAAADPNDPNELRRYTDGTEVMLAATPTEGSFKFWKVFDPNHPGDANYVVEDTNAVLYLTMDADQQVEAVFKCGTSALPAPLMAIIALTVTWIVRRRHC